MIHLNMYIYKKYKIASPPKEQPWLGTTGDFLKACITLGTPHLEHHRQTFPNFLPIYNVYIKYIYIFICILQD